MDKVPNCTTNDTIKGVLVFRQRAGAPKSRYPLKKCVKTSPPNTRASKMNGAYSTTDTAHYIFFDVRVGGCGDLTEG